MTRPGCTPQIKSSVILAKLLKSEGYTPHVANGVRQYAKRMLSSQELKRYERIKMTMRETCLNFSHGDRLVIGRFIAWTSRMAMETGLRIGLATALTVTETDAPAQDAPGLWISRSDPGG